MLAVAAGYVVGKVVVGRVMSALASRFGPAASEEVAAETAAAKAEADRIAAEQAQKEAELLRKLEQKPPRTPLKYRQANTHQEVKMNVLREEYGIKRDQNIAYTEGTIDGNAHDVVAHSGYKNDIDGTVSHTPVEQQQLQTHPTAKDYEQAGRRGEPANPARRAHDSEAKILEHILRKTTPKSTGNIKLVSELPVCESCNGALQQFQQLRPDIRIRIWHAVK